ncbi:methyltransferase [Idiomarina tyrosinivorans]|uniref:Methyltransferase n=1 Tax=Idiomarina tyrosinivorans TaxID=1445662 RepID=A0A432ZFC6_9GAMM|nr:class I SAM-dependent methyltransferase [Idiomarina tyrosinivorans]RUO76604.1 methyltransferase [Idiomarina tyrosinivorans]
MRLITTLQVAAIGAATLLLSGCGQPQAMDLKQAVNSDVRSADHKARDQYRHPAQTLRFFQVEPDMTVVEIWPGGGWYTEILAPYLHDSGTLYAAHFPSDTEVGYQQRSRDKFVQRMQQTPAFENVIVTEFSPMGESAIAPPASADRVLTFRNLHNWYMDGGEEGVKAAFKQFYQALKPGGILGVVDHRLPEDRDSGDMRSSGYMKQQWVIDMAREAGFELEASTEINANPADNADHPKGVWSLPPTLTMGQKYRTEFEKIGESDRFTLKFRKPAQ